MTPQELAELQVEEVIRERNLPERDATFLRRLGLDDPRTARLVALDMIDLLRPPSRPDDT